VGAGAVLATLAATLTVVTAGQVAVAVRVPTGGLEPQVRVTTVVKVTLEAKILAAVAAVREPQAQWQYLAGLAATEPRATGSRQRHRPTLEAVVAVMNQVGLLLVVQVVAVRAARQAPTTLRAVLQTRVAAEAVGLSAPALALTAPAKMVQQAS